MPGQITTGVPGLDSILRGGLPAERTYLIKGWPGSGKTTLGLQFLLEGARRGESVLYITLSESRDELETVAMSHGWNLDHIAIFEMVPQSEVLGSNDQTLFHPAEVDLHDNIERLIMEVVRAKPTRIIFDSLTELRLMSQDELRYRHQLLALKQRLATFKATVLLLDVITRPNEKRLLDSIVPGVIVLDRVSSDYGTIRRRLVVEKMRGLDYRTGYHDYIIEPGGLRVFPRLIAAEHHVVSPSAIITSGIAELDAMLGGGLRQGSSTLLIGPAGTGKSSILASFLYRACTAGEKAVVLAFEETLDIFLERAAGLGMDLGPCLANGTLTVKNMDPAEVSPGELAHALKGDVERGVSMVAIDSLSGYLQAMPDEKHLHLHLQELLTYLNQQGVVSFLTLAQAGIAMPIQTTAISHISDTVILLRFFEAFGRVKKAISVVKKRTGGHQDTIRELQMSNGKIQIGKQLAEFHGILRGVPIFTGKAEDMFETSPA